MSERGEKLILGARLRRLRKTLGLTQAQMAADLGISASYINLIEANQRPVSARLLLQLSQVYDFHLGELSGGGDLQLQAELETALKDPVFGGSAPPRTEVEAVVNASPDIARAILALYDRHRTLMVSALSERNPLSDREKVEILEQSARPVDEVRAHFHARRNHIDALDRRAEALAEEIDIPRNEPQIVLSERLRERHGYRVRILPHDVMPNRLRQTDPHRRHLNLSELLDQAGRRFQIAVQLAFLEFGDLIDAEVKSSGVGPEARSLARTSFANYFAAALLMPYGAFLATAETLKYDVDLLGLRFGTSYEQTAHRLTTLQRPDARGVPFFFVRVDRAGNVSKRFSGGRFHFSKFGGTCPLWNIHSAFETPDRAQTQVIRMPDGTTYFSIARCVNRYASGYREPATKMAIGLGCEVAYAPRLVYAQHLNLDGIAPTEVGVNCYLCERQDCASRAYAPINRPLVFSERERTMSIFGFPKGP
ncbi:helix-turn-helix domain-containing protein [Zavarzinia sp. CC-PAN008]|uniref:helix-turn-helix domain-containing protein n=1 Tax=Zavarzinia sp. CC-PAN008 TaxID=3243332 RepID=UPI003F74606C